MPWALHVVDSLQSEGVDVLPADTYIPDAYVQRGWCRTFFVTPSPVADLEAYAQSVRTHITAAGINETLWGLEGGVHVEAAGDPLTTSLRDFHDKLAFARLVNSLGIRTPRVVSGGDAFARPRWGRAGVGTRRIRLGDAVERGVVLTEFIDGEDLSSLTIARDGVVTAHIAYQHEFLEDEVAVSVRAVATEDVEAVARVLVAATRFNGFMGLDFRRQESGDLYLIECNPRPTPGVLLIKDIAGALTGAPRSGVVLERAQVGRQWMTAATRGWRPVHDIVFDGEGAAHGELR
jgi:hypothetical protein